MLMKIYSFISKTKLKYCNSGLEQWLVWYMQMLAYVEEGVVGMQRGGCPWSLASRRRTVHDWRQCTARWPHTRRDRGRHTCYWRKHGCADSLCWAHTRADSRRKGLLSSRASRSMSRRHCAPDTRRWHHTETGCKGYVEPLAESLQSAKFTFKPLLWFLLFVVLTKKLFRAHSLHLYIN